MTIRKRFMRARRGSMMMLGAMLLPVVLMAGAGAVDFTRTINTRADAQSAMDAAVMSLARMENRDADPQKHGEAFFAQALSGGQAKAYDFAATFTNDETTISGQATVKTPTPLLGVFQSGTTDVMVSARAALPTGGGPLEVAIVLDISTSMLSDEAGGDPATSGLPSRFDNAITGARTLVTHLLDNNPETRIAIVPYGAALRVAPDKFALLEATSLTGLAAPTDAASAGSTVLAERYGAAAYNDISPSSSPLPFVTTLDKFTPVGGTETLYAYGQTYLPLPLSNDLDTILTYLNGLSSTGNTVGHMGFMWGWYAISPKWQSYWSVPGGYPLSYSEDHRKAIILLTDGMFNTPVRRDLDIYEPGASGSPDQAAVIYFTKACNKARQSDVEIYTIRYINGDAVSLEQCAGDPARYFDAQDSTALLNAFENAGTGALGDRLMPARLLN